MYIKVGGYTYSCYEPVQVGDKVLLPAPPWGGRPDMSTVSAVDVGYPPDYDGPIKEVLKVFPQLQPAEITRYGNLPLKQIVVGSIPTPGTVLGPCKWACSETPNLALLGSIPSGPVYKGASHDGRSRIL